MLNDDLKRRIRLVVVELTAILNELNELTEPGEGSTPMPAPRTSGRIRPQDDFTWSGSKTNEIVVNQSQLKLLNTMIRERWRGEPDVRDRAFIGRYKVPPDRLPSQWMDDAVAWLKTVPRLHQGVAAR